MRLIDADALMNIDRQMYLGDAATGRRDYFTIAEIEDAPTIDAVPVVRCKDCRHRDPEDHKCDCGEMERQGCPFRVDDDYYCAYGERKGGVNNG